MNILLIGNGFDIAHGLPTDYKSFVKFMNVVRNIETGPNSYLKCVDSIESCEFCAEFKEFLLEGCNAPIDRRLEEAYNLICNNFWAEYFKPIGNLTNTWISFEKEMSEIIQLLDSFGKSTDRDERRMIMHRITPVFQRAGIEETELYGESNENRIARLLNDLDRLIRCLEIYLCLCLEIVPIRKKLQMVSAIGSVNKVLSFNYTDTFKRIYEPMLETAPEYCYIHGCAKMENTIDFNNMVLGIDEYLDATERSKDIEFVRFKKFYQRIFKKTDYNYMNWVNKHAGTKNCLLLGIHLM